MTDTESARIHILDTHTANRIAAGEVVERPASVVKELTENAIDAGATRIEIRIFDSDCCKLQVSDNGCGMTAADMRMAVLRHATSKISSADDLLSLTTLGFRGEALPSIAAVSLMTITSKTADSEWGYTMTVDAGKATMPQEIGCRQGTTVLVDRLFYNAPARKKFLKSPRTEMRLITDTIANLAVAHPECAFVFRHGNSHAITTKGGNDEVAAILAAYGRNSLQDMLRMALHEQDGMQLHGYISAPSVSRSTRDQYHFFVNGRAVRCRELYAALESAYFTQVPTGRFPAAFLFFYLPPQSIDVNVHPAKLEIKLRDPESVRQLVEKAVIDAMSSMEYLSVGAADAAQLRTVAPVVPLPIRSDREKAQQKWLSSEPVHMTQMQLRQAFNSGQPELETDEFASSIPIKDSTTFNSTNKTDDDTDRLIGFIMERRKMLQREMDQRINGFSYSSLRILGQHLGTYIVCSDGFDLVLIDQHAAAERVNYEHIAAEAVDRPVDASMLAVPISLSFSYSDHLLVTENILKLRDFGFILEYFGYTAYVIRAVPSWYDGNQPENLLFALLDQLRNGVSDSVKLRREELFLAACKKSIKANRYLTAQDISGLFAQLDKCQNKYTCPHGRPIALRITENELRRRFLR
ncbi:MAG: DNA mismatch repair endonuclease MutL [Firmicutes bacterium]|nr:DNA mismatch repair endonuclease MutL [Bacillota bacterium]